MGKKSKIVLILLFCLSALLHAQSSPLELLDEGRYELKRGDYYASLDLFKRALDINPAYVDARKGMAEAFFLLQEYGEALVHAEAALAGAKKRVDILTLMGRIYLGLDMMEEAEKLFLEALAIEPNNTEAAYGRAEIAVLRGNYSEGTELFEKSLAVNADSRRALLSLSLLHEETGDLTRSRQYLNKALEYYPQDQSVLDFAVAFYLKRGEWDAAEAAALKWQALYPDNQAISVVLGTIYSRMERFEDAVGYFKSAVAINQEDSLLWYQLARSYWELGLFDEALISFRTVDIIAPGDEMARIAREHLLMSEYPMGHKERQKAAEYHFEKGLKYERSYQYERAFNEYRRGRILAPLNLQLWWKYADIQNSLGFPNRYRQEMIALKKEGFDDEVFLRVMELLESQEDQSLVENWDGPLSYAEQPLKLSIYFDGTESHLIHTGMEKSLLNFISEEMMGNTHMEILNRRKITDPSEAYRISHKAGSDFYIILGMRETDRTVMLDVSISLSRTGREIFQFSILRSGNGRVSDIILKGTEMIMGSIPVKGILMGIRENLAMINLGASDGLEEDMEFFLLRQGSGRWNDSTPLVEYKAVDLLGTLTVSEIQENYSLALLQRNSPFDLVNPGDEIYILTDEQELPVLPESAVNEELKSQLLRLY